MRQEFVQGIPDPPEFVAFGFVVRMIDADRRVCDGGFQPAAVLLGAARFAGRHAVEEGPFVLYGQSVSVAEVQQAARRHSQVEPQQVGAVFFEPQHDIVAEPRGVVSEPGALFRADPAVPDHRAAAQRTGTVVETELFVLGAELLDAERHRAAVAGVEPQFHDIEVRMFGRPFAENAAVGDVDRVLSGTVFERLFEHFMSVPVGYRQRSAPFAEFPAGKGIEAAADAERLCPDVGEKHDAADRCVVMEMEIDVVPQSRGVVRSPLVGDGDVGGILLRHVGKRFQGDFEHDPASGPHVAARQRMQGRGHASLGA